MNRFLLSILFLTLVLLIPSYTLAFGGPAPELEDEFSPNAAAPATVGVLPTPEVTPAAVVSPASPETKAGPVKPAVTVKPAAKTGLYKVRIGLFSKKEPAAALMNKLKSEGHPAFLVSQAGLWRVQVGAYRDSGKAEEAAAELKAKGYQVDVMASD
jgi:cell division septation protein DedD